MEFPKENTARILDGHHCTSCGWPIIDACCNAPFTLYEDAKDWDWWFYCSNKGCENHSGHGVFQMWPDWVSKGESK